MYERLNGIAKLDRESCCCKIHGRTTHTLYIYINIPIYVREIRIVNIYLKKKRHKIHDLELTYVPDDRPNMLSPNAAFV